MPDSDILISELPSASQVNTDDLVLLTQPDAQSDTGYISKKGTALEVFNKALKGVNYSTDLASFTDKTVLGGMAELKSEILPSMNIGAASGAIASFKTDYSENLIEIKCQIKATGGNGTPDNPNPIIGYTEANITRCGVNLWDEEWEVGNIDGSGADSPANDRIRSKGYIQVKGTTAVYLVIPTAVVVHKYGVDKSYLGNNYVASSGSFSIASDVVFIRFRTDTSYGTTYNNDISINYPATDTEYHAYTGNTYTVAFGQTVYGGVLDVTRGKLHVTHGFANMGDLSWTYEPATASIPFGLFRTLPSSTPKLSGEIKSSCYLGVIKVTSAINNLECAITGTLAYPWVSVRDDAYTDATLFKASVTGQTLIYELATPFDIDLTPEVISALALPDSNNVFADCNGETDVKYYKKYSLQDLDNVVISSASSGQVLKYDGTNWINGTGGGGGASALNDLTDVTITSASNGQFLKYNGSKWVNGSGGSTTLSGLTDVTITTASSGQVLKYNGSVWVNDSSSAPWVDVTGTLTAGNTSLTLNNAAITTSSTIDIFTDTFGVNPTNISVLTGSVTLTFDSRGSDLGVKVRIS